MHAETQTASVPIEIDLYERPVPADVPYQVPVAAALSDDQRQELAEVLAVRASPYADQAAFLDEIQRLLPRIPRFFRDAVEALRARDLREHPVHYLKNCPVGEVPLLDFDAPLESKYALKKDFVAESFLTVFAELYGTPIVTYRTANRGDLFHDILPVRQLQFSKSQKSIRSLHFHTDLPDNRVRPDWVNLLSLRNSPANRVYTAFVRLVDVVSALDEETLSWLRQPLFRAPRTMVQNNILVYGLEELGYLDWKPVILEDRGYEFFCYNESYTVAGTPEGAEAMRRLNATLQQIRCSLFLEQGDFVAICNNTSMHARHVVQVSDLEAHQRRWIMKTWNVDDLQIHRTHLLAGRHNTADE